MWVTLVTSHSKKVLIWISSWGLSLHIPVVSLFVFSGCLQKINLNKAILEMVPVLSIFKLLSEASTNTEIKKNRRVEPYYCFFEGLWWKNGGVSAVRPMRLDWCLPLCFSPDLCSVGCQPTESFLSVLWNVPTVTFQDDWDIYSFHINSTVTSRYAVTVIRSRVVNRMNESKEIEFHVRIPKNAFISKFKMYVKQKSSLNISKNILENRGNKS